MTDAEWISVNEIIKFIEHAINSAKGEDGFKEIYWEKLEYILNLIKRQKAEIEGLEETRYELACIIDELLMCIDEGKETKSAKPIDINEIKSEAIKEFAAELEYFILNEDVEIVKPKCKYYGSYINGANQFRHQIKNGIKKLVKEMEVSE